MIPSLGTPLVIVVLLLLAANVIVPLRVGYKQARQPGGIRVDHIVLFSFGFLFYGLTPIVLGLARIGASNFALGVWYAYFDRTVDLEQIAKYLASMLLFYASFVGASYAVQAHKHARRVAAIDIDIGALSLFWPGAVAFGAVYVWTVRTSLFRGYTAYAQFYTAGGTLSAVTLILLSFILLRLSFAQGLPRGSERAGAMRLYTVIFGVFALVLLSLGGRLYVVTSVMMVLTYFTVYRSVLPYKRVILLFSIGVAAVGAIGVIRLGTGGLSPVALAENIFGEPLFTSFSLLNFLGQNRFELVNVPRFLTGDLLNLVPSFLFPNKSLYLPDPSRFGYVVYAPLGALHMFFSFMINFGLVGSMVVLGALGGWLSWVRSVSTPLMRVIYSMVSGCLAFTFFRDPFSVSLVKNMLEFSVVVPALITLASHVVSTVSESKAPTSRLVSGGDPSSR